MSLDDAVQGPNGDICVDRPRVLEQSNQSHVAPPHCRDINSGVTSFSTSVIDNPCMVDGDIQWRVVGFPPAKKTQCYCEINGRDSKATSNYMTRAYDVNMHRVRPLNSQQLKP